jgi:hypothetical protein
MLADNDEVSPGGGADRATGRARAHRAAAAGAAGIDAAAEVVSANGRDVPSRRPRARTPEDVIVRVARLG